MKDKVKKKVKGSAVALGCLAALTTTTTYEGGFEENFENVNFSNFSNETDIVHGKLIKEYCNIYSLDYELVYSIIKDATNNFEMLNSQYVGLYSTGCSNIKFESVDALLLALVSDVYNYSTYYGYSLEEITSINDISLMLDYNSVIDKFAEITNTDPLLIYSVCDYHTNFNSDLFLSYNNPNFFHNGDVDEDGYSMTLKFFPSVEAGFAELSLDILKNKIDDQYNIDAIISSGFSFLSDNSIDYQKYIDGFNELYNENFSNFKGSR